MLEIDLLTTYVICGAASCAAALMTALVRTGEPALLGALRKASAGFVLLGLSLLQLVVGVAGPLAPTMVAALFGSTVGLGFIGWGLAQLAGQRLHGRWVGLLVGAAVLAQALALRTGPLALGVAYSASIGVLCALTTWALRGFILRPRHAAEALLGWVMLGFVTSYAVRTALGLVHEGPAPVHHAYGSPAVLRVQGILYGVMPVVVATLLLSVVNARLSAQLALRALTDDLTGVMNRRALREQAPALLASNREAGALTAVMLLDIDHFKAINDTHGHLGGDAVLRELVQVLRVHLRPEALVTRFGGEEFALLVPVPDEPAAARAAERLRAAVAAHRFGHGPAAPAVTLSLGLAMLQADETLEAALKRADAALYRAKRAGRNRVEWAEPGAAAVAHLNDAVGARTGSAA